MPWILEINGQPVGFAAIAPPLLEDGSFDEGWIEVAEDSPRIEESLQPALQTDPWNDLTDRLRGSALWQRAFGSAMQSVAANAVMTLMLNSLTSTHSVQDLRFAFLTLRQVMSATPTLSDFSEAELAYLRVALIECGFDPAIVGL